MSKTGKILNRFLLQCLCSATMLMPVFAQSVGSGNTDIGSDIRLRSINNLATSDARRNQLLGNNTSNSASQTAVPQPRPQIDITQTRAPQQRALPAVPATPITNPNDLSGATIGNIAAAPVQTGTPPTIDPDPFAPTGFRLGTFEATASFEQTIGYSSNVSSQADGEGGAFSDTSAALSLTSNWSRHQLQTNLTGSYRKPFDDDEIEQPQIFFDTALRLDLIDGYTLTTTGFYNLSTQGFTSSILTPGSVDNPIQQAYGGNIELQRTDRKLQLTLRGELNKNDFDDAELGGGVIQSQEDRNNTEYNATVRAAYEISPAITPFLQASYGFREFELELDRNGNRRDSNNFEVGGGVEFDLGEKLTGEIALGYINESFDDPQLEELNGFSLNGQLNWSPERDTQVNLTLGTQTNTSIQLDDNGSLIYTGRIDADRQITDRLSVNAFADAQIETNIDNNRTFQVGVGAQYWVNRFMAITTQIDHQEFTTDAPNSGFDATNGQLGIRLQR